MPGELALPRILKLRLPVDTAFAQGNFNIGALQTALAELLTNSQWAIAGTGAVGDKTFKVTGFGKQTLFRQTVEGCFDQLRLGAALTQLTRQLDSTMLATCEQVHGGSPHRDESI